MSIDTLYLGSQSKPRQKLLEETGITYKVLTHTSDERITTHTTHDFASYVLAIAEHKMDNLILPEHNINITGDVIFVLTADTLVLTLETKEVLEKPKDAQDAKRMLRLMQKQPVECMTGCWLEKKVWDGKIWKTELVKSWTTSASIEFIVDEASLDLYLKNTPEAFFSSSSGVVERFGQNFFKSINGSLTAVKGLPTFELRQVLKDIGFNF